VCVCSKQRRNMPALSKKPFKNVEKGSSSEFKKFES